MKENNKLKNIESFESKNSKLRTLINNKKIKNNESDLNSIRGKSSKKEVFANTKKMKQKRENMENILLDKKYNSSVK